jgi:hypothetical protein
VESKIVHDISGDDENPENTERLAVAYINGHKVSKSKDTTITKKCELRLGKIHLVDLAGSERVAEIQAEGEAMVEQQNINKSLLSLGKATTLLIFSSTFFVSFF